MEKLDKILFPTDFSEQAQNAFRHALLFADRVGANVLVAHVVQPITEGNDVYDGVLTITRAEVEAAQKKMKDFVQRGLTQVLRQLKNPPGLNSCVEIGPVIGEIIKIAQREKTGLIIMGAQGEHNLLERLLGTVSAGVVGGATCPVMVVPKNAEPKVFKTIAYATDLNDADPYEIWKATKILHAQDVILRIVHINDKQKAFEGKERLEELETFFSEQPLTVQTFFQHLPGQNVEQVLQDFVNEYGVDLLVMFQPKRSFMDSLFHRSHTKRMIEKTPVPLLVMKT